MKRFVDFVSAVLSAPLLEKAGHLTHVEDSMLYSGTKGAKEALKTLQAVRDRIVGKNSSTALSMTVKWDGAPAIFCGTDPADGKFFVAKKAIFKKVPEVYKTPDEIDAAIPDSPDLARKLKIALAQLPKLGVPKGSIIAGDVMFTKDSVKHQSIDGVEYVTFHPNTIVYAVPANSPAGKKISQAELGVVFHTTYEGSLGALVPKPGVSVAKSMHQVPSIWWQTATLHGMEGAPPKTVADLDALLRSAQVTLSKISPAALDAIASNPDVARDIETYANSLIRSGKEISDPHAHVSGLMAWMKARFEADAAEKKTAAGKAAVAGRLAARMEFFSKENMGNLIGIFKLQQILVTAKRLIITKYLNSAGGVSTFLKTKDGAYEKTGHEGFVAGIPGTGNVVKLVDRLSFSRANFSDEIVKGWGSGADAAAV